MHWQAAYLYGHRSDGIVDASSSSGVFRPPKMCREYRQRLIADDSDVSNVHALHTSFAARQKLNAAQ